MWGDIFGSQFNCLLTFKIHKDLIHITLCPLLYTRGMGTQIVMAFLLNALPIVLVVVPLFTTHYFVRLDAPPPHLVVCRSALMRAL
mgnify:CR=1 FL=1